MDYQLRLSQHRVRPPTTNHQQALTRRIKEFELSSAYTALFVGVSIILPSAFVHGHKADLRSLFIRDLSLATGVVIMTDTLGSPSKTGDTMPPHKPPPEEPLPRYLALMPISTSTNHHFYLPPTILQFELSLPSPATCTHNEIHVGLNFELGSDLFNGMELSSANVVALFAKRSTRFPSELELDRFRSIGTSIRLRL
jgi:hypothetical protein